MMLRRTTRRLPADDSGAALVLSLIVILVAAVLSVAIAGELLVQVVPAQGLRKTNRTESAAEAGFDAALNRIRAATDGTNGVVSQLPCGPVSGSVSSNSGALTYSVTIAYYRSNPSGRSASWLADNANRIACSGAGPTEAPAFALLVSKGAGSNVPGVAAGRGNRTLSSVYEFKTTNENIAGGLIHLYNQDTPLCLGTSSYTNPPGKDDKLTLWTCDRNQRGQNWIYTTSLHLQVAGTNFCLEARSQKNELISLQPCDETKATQIWSFNDIGRFEGNSLTAKGKLNNDGFCFTSKDNPGQDGSVVWMQQECSGSYDYVHTFSPEAAVGAGNAGESVGNLVNYRYFGRCLDVTSQNVNSGWLIGYPCKQKPDPSLLTWNQVFTYNAVTKQYVTASPSGAYCLQAGSTGSPPVTGTRILVKPCNTGEQFQQWTNTKDTGDYASSYNVLTKSGLCMSLTVPGPAEADPYLRQWGMVVAETCNGSTEQKWNAPPNLTAARMTDTQEKTGG